MRLFAGMPLGGEAAGAAARALARLERRGWPVKWSRPDQLHLTLKFFGDVPEEGAAPLADALEGAVAGRAGIPAALAGYGAFPTPARARVLWLGLDAGPELELLQHEVEVRTAPLGFPPEGRPFHPHLTLGRVREGQRLPADAAGVFEAAPLGLPLSLDTVVLYRSQLGPAGSRYDVVRSWTLGAAGAGRLP